MISRLLTKAPDSLGDPKECPYYLISRVSLAITSALKGGFSEAGVERVRPGYMGVLLVLWREDNLKVNELGRQAGLEPSTMTGLIDRMERDRFVKRVPDPADRRVMRIQLTEEGRGVQSAALRVVDRILADALGGVSAKEIASLKEILRRVLTNLNEEESDGSGAR